MSTFYLFSCLAKKCVKLVYWTNFWDCNKINYVRRNVHFPSKHAATFLSFPVFCVSKPITYLITGTLLWKQRIMKMFIIKIFIEIQKFKLLFVKKSTDKNIMVCVKFTFRVRTKPSNAFWTCTVKRDIFTCSCICRAWSRKLRQRPILAKKGTFLNKRHKKITTPCSIPFESVLDQNKAMHNFHK